MSLLRTASLALAVLFFGADLDAAPRTWHDTTGRALKAEFLYADSDKVYLKLEGGTISEIALGLLSNEDLEFIQTWERGRKKQGITFEAPLVFEIYRSKKFSAAQAQNAGYFPLGSGDSGSILRLEFRRYGKKPEGSPQPVLRIHTASPQKAATTNTIEVFFRGKRIGSVAGAKHNSQIDIPLKPSVLAQAPLIEFTLKCGRDEVLIRSTNTGKGPRLLVLDQSGKSGK